MSNSDGKFMNTLIQKYHNHELAAAGAPTHIQQASLAQNTRFYNAGPKSERMGTKKKIAAVIAGERKAWHSPDCPIPQHAAQVSKQSPTILTFAPTITVRKQTLTHTAKNLRFSFQAPNAQHADFKTVSKCIDLCSTLTVMKQTWTCTAKKLRFSFQAPNAQINFEYDF